jgi:hypothetical protein
LHVPKGCFQMAALKKDLISNETEFLNSVRNDASREKCLKDLEKIDFEKNRIYGVTINSGYCRVPVGLKFTATKDVENKQLILNISYLKPNGICRALSRYDLWVVLPKPPRDYYGFRYQITEIERTER